MINNDRPSSARLDVDSIALVSQYGYTDNPELTTQQQRRRTALPPRHRHI